ncbi:MAG TPA: energy transducer TonB [Trinickia sp.]|uniref:energy transducer TonB n=1 Tax=Trinickia sp. TaxID=2571163 RepID=UPI002C996664|nr:energy transducer TonB [Trinickia sp.]HVW50589.1 energy transducer TonB [Trinickia sp.]
MFRSRIVPSFVFVALAHAALLAVLATRTDAPVPRHLQSAAMMAQLLAPAPNADRTFAPPVPEQTARTQHTQTDNRAAQHAGARHAPAPPTTVVRPAADAAPHPVAQAAAAPPDQTSRQAAQAAANASPASAANTARPPESGSVNAAAASAARATIALAAPKRVERADCRIVKPSYPDLSKRREETGTATVRFVIDTAGAIGNITLVKSSGFSRLDDAAIQALRESACRPYDENGTPIRVSFEQAFTFGLDDD